MKSVLQGVWGTPHQAKGGDSSESPPDVFWLQKTLLATFVGNLTLLGESFVPCLHAEAKQARETNCYKGSFAKPVQNSTTVSSLFLCSIHKIPLQKNRTAALLRVCGLRSLLISAFGAVDDFRSEELRLKIYPQSGANGVFVVSDIVATPIDAAVVVDKCSVV